MVGVYNSGIAIRVVHEILSEDGFLGLLACEGCSGTSQVLSYYAPRTYASLCSTISLAMAFVRAALFGVVLRVAGYDFLHGHASDPYLRYLPLARGGLYVSIYVDLVLS